MTREEFKAMFRENVTPILKRIPTWANEFHQFATDAQSRRWVFWPLMALAGYGALRVVWW